ncbi:MAG: hypothetical protein ACW964_15875 [Candidatus Hodarchaeales archaeon]|jgi:hypothetical protein
MRKNMLSKILVMGVIFLFVGVGVQSAFAIDIPEKEEIEPKDYLFEFIVAIANNPDVQELFGENGNNAINLNFNNKNIFRQLLFRNPKLLCSMIFPKPEMTTQYLNKAYKQGIELINIFGEEKAIEMLGSIEVTNPELLDGLNNIIMNDEDLSNRISTLIELNGDNSTICNILFILIIITWIRFRINLSLWEFFEYTELEIFFDLRLCILALPMLFLFELYDECFDCFNQTVNYKNPYEINQIITTI